MSKAGQNCTQELHISLMQEVFIGFSQTTMFRLGYNIQSFAASLQLPELKLIFAQGLG